jgi:hypothetical protein
VTIKQSNGSRVLQQAAAAAEAAVAPRVTAEDVKAQIEARLQASLEKLISTPRQEIAEPLNWWDLYGVGPIQPSARLAPPLYPAPLLPHQVIRVGEQAFIVTVMVLNPFELPNAPGVIPCEILSSFCLPYSIEYHTCNVTECKPGPANLNVKHEGHLEPGQCFYVDVLEFIAQEEGCIFETNICARILCCEYENEPLREQPPFAGFATWTYSIDDDFLANLYGLWPSGPGFYKSPVRFMVYE